MRAAPGDPRRGENPMTAYQSRSVSAAHGEQPRSSLREVVSNRSKRKRKTKSFMIETTAVTEKAGQLFLAADFAVAAALVL